MNRYIFFFFILISICSLLYFNLNIKKNNLEKSQFVSSKLNHQIKFNNFEEPKNKAIVKIAKPDQEFNLDENIKSKNIRELAFNIEEFLALPQGEDQIWVLKNAENSLKFGQINTNDLYSHISELSIARMNEVIERQTPYQDSTNNHDDFYQTNEEGL